MIRMTQTDQPTDLTRAQWLKAQTDSVHEALDNTITARGAFESRDGYAGFVRMQMAFHRDIAALYDRPDVRAIIPDLAERRRLHLVEADAQDLGLDTTPPRVPLFEPGATPDLATALGWLYVAEGSNMGAALLRKAVQKIGLSDEFGARHLAPAAPGPAAHWRAFVSALDAAPLDADGDRRAAQGARDAFAHVRGLADACFA